MPESTASPPGRRRLFVTVYAVFLLIVTAAVLRLVHVDADVWDYYYPELDASGATSASRTAEDKTIDVLTLGGSVLLQVEEDLEQRLRRDLGANVRCFHLSTTAHTSRDSWLKYRLLAAQRFDVVLVCHGINDVRMNYWPADQFRDDYTHCPWYAGILRDTATGRLTLWDRLKRFATQEGLGPPTAADHRHGETIKTATAFETNLRQVVDEARRREDRVLLLTMAAYLPEGYTRTAFDTGQLDYGSGEVRHAAELWGAPQQVVRGIAEHNQRTRTVASSAPNVGLVDLERKLAAEGTNFSDICHLTRVGRQRLVDAVVPVIVEMLGDR